MYCLTGSACLTTTTTSLLPHAMKTILAYHSVGDCVSELGAELYCVHETEFRKQLDYLKTHRPSCVITFDDGDMTNYTKVYPILKELGLKAYFFIIGEWVGKPGYMGWEEIQALAADGMTIGSHGMTHRIMTTLKRDELEYELTASKKILENKLNIFIDSMSIPRGFFNTLVIDSAKAAGYTQIFTSDERIVVKANWDMRRFIDTLNGKRSLAEDTWGFLRNTSKKLLGAEVYNTIRAKLLNLNPKS